MCFVPILRIFLKNFFGTYVHSEKAQFLLYMLVYEFAVFLVYKIVKTICHLPDSL